VRPHAAPDHHPRVQIFDDVTDESDDAADDGRN
jgi:hypothetical protein